MKKVLSILFTTIFVFSSLTTVLPKQVEAQFVPVGDIINLEFHSWDFLKENALDAVVFAAAKAATQQLVGNMIDWVSSGFEGEPAFVTNESAFVGNIHDIIIVELLVEETADIYNEAPFRNYLISAIADDYSSSYKDSGYNLDKLLSDDNAFLGGDFLIGGWDGWYAMTQNPDNNYYGARLKTQKELARRQSVAQENIQKELDRGDGFFSLKDSLGNIATPGNLISSQLDLQLGTGLRQLEAADEFSELISAAITTLSQSVIQEGLNQANGAASNAIDGAQQDVDSINSLLNDAEGVVDTVEETTIFIEETAAEYEAQQQEQ